MNLTGLTDLTSLRSTGTARKALGALCLTAIAALALGSSAPRLSMAAPAQQALTCKWQNIDSSRSESLHGALAMDTDENIAYWYGGANSDLSTSNKLEATDLSGSNLS